MNKKKIIITITFILVILLIGIGLYLILRPSKDALKFKQEYEALNNTIRESDGATYNNVKISKNNPIKYIDCQEALEILKKEEAIIYIGAPWCPWCRNAIPVLFEAAKKQKVKTIYYLNLDNEKSTFEIQDGTLVTTKEGSADYYRLLEQLKDLLTDYSLTDNDGKIYETGEKRIYIPYVIAVKDGEIVSTHNGTVSLNENQTKYDELTQEQHDELYNIYNKMLKKVYN